MFFERFSKIPLMDPKEGVSVVIPAYNEEKGIVAEIRTIHEAFRRAGRPYEIIVVDDGSVDNTAELVKAEPSTKLVRHPRNRGVGAARKSGIWAAQYDTIITTDGDGTYPNDRMPELVDQLKQCDMVVGARIGKKVAKSWIRMPAKWFIRRLACYLTRTYIPDLNSGLRAFRKQTALRFFYLLPDSHSWEATITLAYLCNHKAVVFTPIDYYKRKGKSSFHPIRDTYNYISLVIRTIMYFNPTRIFIPLAFIVSAIGIGKMTFDYFTYGNIGGFDVVLVTFALLIFCMGLLADLMVVLHRKLDPPEHLPGGR